MTFWISITLLSVAAMGFVLYPLFKSRVSSRSELESEQTLYQARLAEIEKDLELGRLDATSAEAAKAEEARRLIKASENTKTISVSRGNKAIVLLAALSLPLFSIPFYYNTGSPDVISPQPRVAENTGLPSIEQLLQVAEKRLADNPDDVNGWKVVGPVYMRLGRYNDAIKAYENILRVEGRKPEFLIRLADVYIEQGQGQIDDKAKALIAETLSIEPKNPTARYYSGIVALQSGKQDETRRIWQAILDGANGDEDWVPVIKGRIAELDTLEQETPKVPLPKLDEDTLEAAAGMSADERQEMITQMVANLAERLEENPDDKQGWERLIRSYIILGRYEDANKALEAARKQYSSDEAFMTFLQNMVKAQEGTIQ